MFANVTDGQTDGRTDVTIYHGLLEIPNIHPQGGWASKNKLFAEDQNGVPQDPFLMENKTKLSLFEISHSSVSYRFFNFESVDFRVQAIKAEPATRFSRKHASICKKVWRIRI